jgi:LuxR family maltose regulon positive regulatory protein
LAQLAGTPADTGAAASVTGAWIAALTGDQREMRRRLAILETSDAEQPLPDGTSSPRSALLLVRGLFGFDGPERMLADARGAVELETDPASPWHAVACAALGYAAFVVGDGALTRRMLHEAANSVVAPRTIHILAHALLSLSAAEDGQAGLARSHAEQAMAIVTEHGMQAMPNVLHAYTAYGAMLAADNRLTEAMDTMHTGLHTRRRTPGLSPWPLIHHLLAMAAVARRLGDLDQTETLLAEVDSLTPWTGDTMALTRGRIAVAHQGRHHQSEPAAAGTGEALTPRELEILHRLHGTQTLREIANDLYISHNTIKTITLSIYRKLGVHTREQAVATARSGTSRPTSRPSSHRDPGPPSAHPG